MDVSLVHLTFLWKIWLFHVMLKLISLCDNVHIPFIVDVSNGYEREITAA